LTAVEADAVVRASEGCPLALLEFGQAMARGIDAAGGTPMPLSAGLESAFGAAVRA
jgi:hypothetical protein